MTYLERWQWTMGPWQSSANPGNNQICPRASINHAHSNQMLHNTKYIHVLLMWIGATWFFKTSEKSLIWSTFVVRKKTFVIIFCDILWGRQMVFLGWLKTTGKGQVSPDQKILSVKLHLQFLVMVSCYKSQNCDWLLAPLVTGYSNVCWQTKILDSANVHLVRYLSMSLSLSQYSYLYLSLPW